MSKILVTNELGKISLSAVERRLLGRPSIQFELSRVVKAEEVQLPGKAKLALRISKGRMFAGQSGEYRVGFKKVLVIGRSGATGVKITLSNPAFDELYIATKDPAAFIAKLGK